MQMFTFLPLLSLFCPLILSACSRAAPTDVTKDDQSDVAGPVGQFDDVSGEGDLAKRLSSFVRIGRPNSFVRIGRGSRFVRIGRPGNFVRIGRGYEGDLDDLGYDTEGDNYNNADKRASRFVRIGKGSRFVRIGKSGQVDPQIKRMSSFVRIGKADPYSDLDSDDLSKRASSFVRIGRIPSSAFVRIGRASSEDSGEAGDFGTFDRIARMGQSSFVRIGKREADPEKLAAQAHNLKQ
uniref:FxRIamide-2 n=1 Tax=Charonia tritonis TaxID=1960912 RepID=A0A1S6JQ23_9CAEN|nr:FxRIamide-2 precursor [Charonia tritonis]